jgi:hypothetical protein
MRYNARADASAVFSAAVCQCLLCIFKESIDVAGIKQASDADHPGENMDDPSVVHVVCQGHYQHIMLLLLSGTWSGSPGTRGLEVHRLSGRGRQGLLSCAVRRKIPTALDPAWFSDFDPDLDSGPKRGQHALQILGTGSGPLMTWELPHIPSTGAPPVGLRMAVRTWLWAHVRASRIGGQTQASVSRSLVLVS